MNLAARLTAAAHPATVLADGALVHLLGETGAYDAVPLRPRPLQRALEQEPMGNPEFVYTTYINTTPERLWQALTEPVFTRRYWGGAALVSDWRVGSPVNWQDAPDEEAKDLGQVVLEADPYRRLSYTWHGFRPEHAEFFGWTDTEFAELLKERRSKVTFEIEPYGSAVRLTVIHDDFDPGSRMYEAISGRLDPSGGWPELLANLKTLLETGEVLPGPVPPDRAPGQTPEGSCPGGGHKPSA